MFGFKKKMTDLEFITGIINEAIDMEDCYEKVILFLVCVKNKKERLELIKIALELMDAKPKRR